MHLGSFFELCRTCPSILTSPNLWSAAAQRFEGRTAAVRGGIPMEVYTKMKDVRIAAMVLAVCLLVVCQSVALAQNLGAAPQVNVAVQGQTGAQPEGAFLNFVNWVGNVIAPVGAGVAVVGGIVSYASGRGYLRWIGTALGLLVVSGSDPIAGVLDRAGRRREFPRVAITMVGRVARRFLHSPSILRGP